MENQPLAQVIARIKTIYGSWTKETTLAEMRQDWDNLYAADMSNVELEDIRIGDLPCRWVKDKSVAGNTVLLFIHGGGFRLGSVTSHQGLMAGLSAASGAKVLGVEYRLMPDFQYPAQLEDCYAAYSWLLAQGIKPASIALVGDSAGGNLVAALLNLLQSKAEPLPGAAVYMSPWFDMTASADSYETRAEFDPIHQKKMILALARGYLGNHADANDPLTSPILADLAGLPPTLIQVGDHEVGLGDSLDYAKKAKAAGVEVELEVWDDMIHVFQLFAPDLPEAARAIENAGVFIKNHLKA